MLSSLNGAILDWLQLYGVPAVVLWYVYAFILGGCFGSFTTACVWRIPRGISIVWPPSSCPKCGHRLGPMENIPIFGWIWLRGKCKGCGMPISPRYLIIEVVTALLFAGMDGRSDRSGRVVRRIGGDRRKTAVPSRRARMGGCEVSDGRGGADRSAGSAFFDACREHSCAALAALRCVEKRTHAPEIRVRTLSGGGCGALAPAGGFSLRFPFETLRII